ncbi:SAF domain-containing protein [Schaalia vaccimaxillae]|uniref:SAF domain-containing protein n=1 Tax=Schaalia vaccimaxillae TaxID=183916 RepID=UPI0003B54911|nr:SAF domain-containing protein [Schaalia vaccimaxillae]
MSFLSSWPFLKRLLVSLSALAIVMGIFVVLYGASPGMHVLVASQDLEEGQELSNENFTLVRVPSRAAPADAVPNVKSIGSHWRGPKVARGTIITESLLAGSAQSRALSSGKSRVSLVLDAAHVPELAAGDVVDLWSIPVECDETVCPATLLVPKVLIASLSNEDVSQWEASYSVRADVIVDSSSVQQVLGQSGTSTLSLVLRGSHPPDQATE